MIASLDDGVGRVHAALGRRSMLNGSLLLFMSDNGGPILPESCNGGLRGGKGAGFEGGVRVPVFVWWPSCLRPALIDVPVAMWDVMPTLVHAAGFSLTGSAAISDSGSANASASNDALMDALSGRGSSDALPNSLSEEFVERRVERAVQQASAGRSWWLALAGRCEQDGCGVGAHASGELQRRGSGQGRDARLLTLELSAATSAVVEGDLKLVATAQRCLDVFLEAQDDDGGQRTHANSSLPSAAVRRPASGSTERQPRHQQGLSRSVLALVVKQMERLKHLTMPGCDPARVVGGASSAERVGEANHGAGLASSNVHASAAMVQRPGEAGKAPPRELRRQEVPRPEPWQEQAVRYELFDLRHDPYEREDLLLLSAAERRALGQSQGAQALEPALSAALRRLKTALRVSARRASAALEHHRPEAGLKFWFCAQSFKSNSLDWPLVQAYHTCDGRSEREKWGEPRFLTTPAGRKSERTTLAS